jgi:hypothetical protein
MDRMAGTREQYSEKNVPKGGDPLCSSSSLLLLALLSLALQTLANASLKTENRPIRCKCMETYS